MRALFGKAVLWATLSAFPGPIPGYLHFQGPDRAFQRDQGVSRLVASGHDTVRPLGES